MLCLLDTPHLAHGTSRFDLPSSTPGMLLACLGIYGDWMPRERLMTLFWPDATETAAQHHLRVTLHRARQWLVGTGLAEHLVGERRRLRLGLACDVPQFRAAIGCGDWPGAVALHRAPLLNGAAPRGFAAVDEWLALERDALTTAWRNAALRQAARLEATADVAAAASLLQTLLRFDLLAEDVLQALLRVAAAAGERSTALHTFEQFRERAASELGLEPLPGTVALAQALKRLRPDAAPALPPAALVARPSLPAALLSPPLVGRLSEQARLVGAGPGVTVVAGEPGIGKTRLVIETLTGATVWRCRDGMQSIPLLPAAEWLRREAARVRVHVATAATLRELARLEPALAPGELLSPADGQSPGLLLALCAALPLLTDTLVIDDLQWIDSATLQLLRMLAAETPLRIVATMRPAEAPAEVTRWLAAEQAAGRLHRTHLSPLPSAATAALMAKLAGHEAPRFAAWLQRASGGNPFFALETLRALFEGGQLRAEAGGWASDLDALSVDYRELAVPERVAAVVQQRLGGLPETAQRVLLAAAVVGDAAHEDLLAQVVGLSAWATAEALALAQQAGLLTGHGFAHDLAREALLAGTAPALLRVLHAGVVRHGQACLGPHRQAAHAWAAGLETEAVEATLLAAVHDRELGLLDEAQALLGGAQERTADRSLRARLALERAECAESAGNCAAAEAHVQEVLDTSGDRKLRALALGVRVVVLQYQGQLADARRLADDIEILDPGWPDRHTTGAKLAYARGDFTRAIEHMQSHVAMLQTRGASADLASALSGLATAVAGQGRLGDAVPLHHEAITMARRFKARYFEVYAISNYLWTAARLTTGHAEAAALGRAALALGEYASSPSLRVNLGSVLQRLDAHAEAAALYEQQALRGDDPTVAAVCWARLVDARVQLGERAGLGDVIERALSLLTRTDNPVAQAAAVIAALEHGDAIQVQRALAALRDWPLPVDQKQRLQAARRRHTALGAG